MSSTKDSVDWKTAFWIVLPLLLLTWVAELVKFLRPYLSPSRRYSQSASQTGDGIFNLVTCHNNEGHCAENENCTTGNNLDGIEEGVISDRDGPEEL